MNITRRLSILLSLMLLLSACNLPGAADPARPSDPAPAVSATALPPGGGSEATGAADAPPTDVPTPAASPTPGLPPGWQAITRPALALTFYAPPGWELVPADNDAHLDLYEQDGPGWLSIDVITAANADHWGIPYSPSLSAEALIDAILAPLNQNGAFPPSRPVLTRSGRTARVSAGLYDRTSEYLLVGVIALADRAWLVLGHGPHPADPSAETRWADQQALYEQVLATLGPAE